MRSFFKALKIALPLLSIVSMTPVLADSNPNQTSTTSPIFSENELPYRIVIETADFLLPNGIHSGVSAVCGNKWLLFAGRTNGLHGFDSNNNNFPPQEQNSTVYVVDPSKKTVFSKSLYDPSSGLTQHQIDLLSVTSPQFYQDKETLYITGGYGVDTETGDFSTKDALTAVNVPGLINWVLQSSNENSASKNIRQIFDPIFQVTGGYMAKNHDGLTLLIFGQNFDGFYTDSSNGTYLEQVERFYIKDDGKNLSFKKKKSLPEVQDPNYRRRDLNVIPIVLKNKNKLTESFVALSGVFTENGGIWTVPVFITNYGKPSMPDPANPNTFKQAMNNYASATVGLFSEKDSYFYSILLGGISYGYYQGQIFKTDTEFPFINQITTIRIDENKNCKQFLMYTEYPLILSTGSNPGNQLLFGAGADFIPSNKCAHYKNGVLKYDELNRKKTFLGYIVGGIASTLPNTNTQLDSTASPYIFKVYLYRK